MVLAPLQRVGAGGYALPPQEVVAGGKLPRSKSEKQSGVRVGDFVGAGLGTWVGERLGVEVISSGTE